MITPLDVVLGSVEKYHAPEFESGVATHVGVALNAVANVCAVVTVPVVLDTVPLALTVPGTQLIKLCAELVHTAADGVRLLTYTADAARPFVPAFAVAPV